MAHMKLACAHCGFTHLFEVRRVNRACSIGAPLYCGKECAGLARRVSKSAEQKRAEKAAYDAERRVLLADRIKAEKADYYVWEQKEAIWKRLMVVKGREI